MVKHRTGYKPSIDEDNQTKDRRIAELEGYFRVITMVLDKNTQSDYLFRKGSLKVCRLALKKKVSKDGK